jgi:hypothetical protein
MTNEDKSALGAIVIGVLGIAMFALGAGILFGIGATLLTIGAAFIAVAYFVIRH